MSDEEKGNENNTNVNQVPESIQSNMSRNFLQEIESGRSTEAVNNDVRSR